MKKPLIILGSVLGVGVAAGAGVLIYVLAKPYKGEPSISMIDINNDQVNLFPTAAAKRTAAAAEETIAQTNFEDAITKNKDKLQTFAGQVKANKKLRLEIIYKDGNIHFDFQMKETGSPTAPKLKVIINKVHLYKNETDGTLEDGNIKGTKISDFKAYARKFIYALWKLEKEKNPDASLTDIKTAIAAPAPADLDADVTPIA